MKVEVERLERPLVEEMESILGKPFKVLNDGFVRVVDYLGADSSIVQAARVSYGKGTKKVQQDRGLIRYLMRHRHSTPFEMCEIKLHVRVPMDCWRQWIRHRTANINEYSTRYSVAVDATQTTKPNEWRLQAVTNRQGSEGTIDEKKGTELTQQEKELQNFTRKVYNEKLELGIAREQARKDLLLSTYTEAYWKIDLHNLLHFLALRMEENAQHEIRQYAHTIGKEIVSKWCPIAWEAFQDYRINSMVFSKQELEIIKHISSGNSDQATEAAKRFEWINVVDGKLKGNLERAELEEKLESMDLSIPWESLK